VARDALEARGLGDVEVEETDLSDLASVRAFTERFLATGRSVAMLINNAGIMATPEARVGDGWESQFATNHLGHYVLTNLLWPALIASGGARVVALSSTGHKLSGIRFADPQFTTGYDKWLACGQAKTANSLFAVQLDKLGAAQGVRAFAVHPGGIMTNLSRHLPREEMIASGSMAEDGTLNEGFKSPERARRRRPGRPPHRCSTGWAASTAKTAISPSHRARQPHSAHFRCGRSRHRS